MVGNAQGINNIFLSKSLDSKGPLEGMVKPGTGSLPPFLSLHAIAILVDLLFEPIERMEVPMKKNLFALVLALALFASLIAGCAQPARRPHPFPLSSRRAG